MASTAGLTTQVTILGGGNPLTYSVVSGPSGVSIDPHSGVVTYTPTAGQVGTQSATFQVSNPLGAVQQTIQFNVGAASTLPRPTLRLSTSKSTYDGQYQQVSAQAIGADGVTPVAGTIAVAYGGGAGGYMHDVGRYQVLLTFTSSDPAYANATLLASYTITPATPSISGLSAQTIAVGTAATLVSGHVAAGSPVTAGDFVIVTLGGVAEDAVVDSNGNFSASLNTSALPVGQYAVSYSFSGDANFKAARLASSTLKVIPTAPPRVTLNPTDVTSTAGDPASFTANATGSPSPTVQWQVSIDGGSTWADVTSNASAQTTSLVFTTYTGQGGYEYRAVFTNPYGTAISAVATLSLDSGN